MAALDLGAVAFGFIALAGVILCVCGLAAIAIKQGRM